MTDRELLEMAAKAAGYKHHWHSDGLLIDAQCGPWNPLTDDGDALRLAVKLEMDVMCASVRTDSGIAITIEAGTDPYAATRLAIVRAAAAIGKEMP